jgi:hypothetical protein
MRKSAISSSLQLEGYMIFERRVNLYSPVESSSSIADSQLHLLLKVEYMY